MAITLLVNCGIDAHKTVRHRFFCDMIDKAQLLDSTEEAARLLKKLEWEFGSYAIYKRRIYQVGTWIILHKEPHPKIFNFAYRTTTVTELIRTNDVERARCILMMGGHLHKGLTKENVSKASPEMMALFARHDWDGIRDWVHLFCEREDTFLANLISLLCGRIAYKFWLVLAWMRTFSEASLQAIFAALASPISMTSGGARYVLGKLKGLSIKKDPVAVILRNKDALIEHGCTINTAAHFDCLGFAEIIKDYTCLCPEPKVIVGDYYSLEMNYAYKRLLEHPPKADI
jgi:hypothetical protein